MPAVQKRKKKHINLRVLGCPHKGFGQLKTFKHPGKVSTVKMTDEIFQARALMLASLLWLTIATTPVIVCTVPAHKTTTVSISFVYEI